MPAPPDPAAFTVLRAFKRRFPFGFVNSIPSNASFNPFVTNSANVMIQIITAAGSDHFCISTGFVWSRKPDAWTSAFSGSSIDRVCLKRFEAVI